MDTMALSELLYADEAAAQANQALTAAGGQLYIVGGAVRDSVLGKTPKDIDLMVTGLTGDQIEAALNPVGRLDFTGKAFGVYRFKVGKDEVEIAMPRTETSTGPAHTDFDVAVDHNLSVEDDLGRRDFTGNAMAVHTTTGELVDPFGGAEDLRNKQLKLVNEQAFADDPLRIVRALVANARFGLEPDPAVIASMKEHADQVRHLPGERIQMEMDKLLAGANPASAVKIAFETGLIDYIAPELSSVIGFDQQNVHHDLPVDEHTLQVLRKMTNLSSDPDLRLAALFHDSGKPDSFWRDETQPEGQGGHFYQKVLEDGTTIGRQHEEVGAELVRAFMERLRYPKARQDRVEKLVAEHMFAPFENERGARRFLKQVGDEKTAWDMMLIREADASGKNDGTMSDWDVESLATMKEKLTNVLEAENAFTVKNLAIGGNDLKQIGIKPGPEMGTILNGLLDKVIDDPELNNREDLLRIVEQERNDQTQ
jgi:tRNA nucleotidyltransferase (CCA-adding enzyme)